MKPEYHYESGREIANDHLDDLCACAYENDEVSASPCDYCVGLSSMHPAVVRACASVETVPSLDESAACAKTVHEYDYEYALACSPVHAHELVCVYHEYANCCDHLYFSPQLTAT